MEIVIDDEVLHYNRLGIIPGPNENMEDFKRRAQYCLGVKNSFESKLSEEAPFSFHNFGTEEILREAFPLTTHYYDIQPNWIPVLFSNYKLSFWHGGCAWIYQENEQSPTCAFFQLRKAFESNKTYLGLYKRDELIAHELSHVGRMMFEEVRFEEVLAYRSDASRFRRYFGPIMQSSWESALFILILFLIMIIDFSLATMLSASKYEHMMWLKLFPFGMLVYALGRLVRKQCQFKNCFEKILQVCKNERQANAIIYRLTDEEIVLFAQLPASRILDYAKQQAKSSLRWAVITTAYFSEGSVSCD